MPRTIDLSPKFDCDLEYSMWGGPDDFSESHIKSCVQNIVVDDDDSREDIQRKISLLVQQIGYSAREIVWHDTKGDLT